jgi:hypothetical protein
MRVNDLDHASNILLLGKAYFHVMRSQVTLLDSASKSRTAPDRTPFLLKQRMTASTSFGGNTYSFYLSSALLAHVRRAHCGPCIAIVGVASGRSMFPGVVASTRTL